MSHAIASTKVSGGKLVRLKVEVSNNTITHAEISGDFFIYPEDTIIELEETLTDLNGPINYTQLKQQLEEKTEHAQLVGFSVDTIIQLLKEALGDK